MGEPVPHTRTWGCPTRLRGFLVRVGCVVMVMVVIMWPTWMMMVPMGVGHATMGMRVRVSMGMPGVRIMCRWMIIGIQMGMGPSRAHGDAGDQDRHQHDRVGLLRAHLSKYRSGNRQVRILLPYTNLDNRHHDAAWYTCRKLLPDMDRYSMSRLDAGSTRESHRNSWFIRCCRHPMQQASGRCRPHWWFHRHRCRHRHASSQQAGFQDPRRPRHHRR